MASGAVAVLTGPVAPGPVSILRLYVMSPDDVWLCSPPLARSSRCEPDRSARSGRHWPSSPVAAVAVAECRPVVAPVRCQTGERLAVMAGWHRKAARTRQLSSM